MSELLELCSSENLSFDALQETINALGPHLSSQNPLCLHKACSNKKVTLEIVQLLHSTIPEALRSQNSVGYLPVHHLCTNKDLDDTTSLDILRFMLNIYPTLPREVGYGGWLPIHYAVQYKSTAFCKELIDAYPESLRVEVRGELPIHLCARSGRVDAADIIQYMLELDPEVINAEDSDGCLPIHCAAMYGHTKSIELLLEFDPDAASKKANDDHRQLPLHLVCGSYYSNLSSVKVLYDAYPEAILASDGATPNPLDIARFRDNQLAIDFLQTQLVYARQARDMTAMTAVDDNGWLPLHHALKDNVPLGSIKLLSRANPAAVQVADPNGAYPLPVACEYSSVKVVKYLVELAGDIVVQNDANNNSLLHYACRGGNCETIKYLLERNAPSVSERNKDNKLSINLLFDCGENILDRESLEYIESIWELLLANPEVVRDFDFQRGCKKRRLVD